MAGIGKYKKGAKFTLKSGNSPSYKMMGSKSPFDMVGDEMVERARKSKARTDLLKQLTPEEKAKYDALSGKEKFHVSQNTNLSQMRQALDGDEPSMELMAATGAAGGAGTRGATPRGPLQKDDEYEEKVSDRPGTDTPPDDSGDWEKVTGTRIWKRKKKKTTTDKTTTKKKDGAFDRAFAAARKAGKKTFNYKGKSYNTKLA